MNAARHSRSAQPHGTTPASGDCPHRPSCPGCPRFGEPGIAPAALEALATLARQHALPSPKVISGVTTGFRLRARLAIRGRRGAPKIGMFQVGSHRVVPIPRCSVQHPLINGVATVVRQALIDADVEVYADVPHTGVARYLQVVVERSSRAAQVVLVANSPTPEPVAACLALVRDRLGDDLHSLWFNAQCDRTNAILGTQFVRCHGPESVVERFGGAAVHYPPGAFGQNNLEIGGRIVDHVRDLVPDGSRVTEYYAGVGAIGLSMLPRLRSIRMNEVSPASLQGLQLGLADLGPDERAKVEVVPGLAGEACAAVADAEVVIADPPRKGLDRELVDRLSSDPPQRFIYVSCGLESFLADTQRLTAAGRLRLTSLRAFNLMPYTGHVETVACFERG